MKSLAISLLGLTLAADAFAQGAPQPAWSDRYGPSGYDAAGAVATDAQGNVYVGGASPAGSSGSSFVVIKYGPAGAREWVARHSGADGKALNVAVDGRGNVFAAGYRWVGPYEVEDVVVKFDAAGRELWWRRLGGRSTKLLPDPAGNLYVIGRVRDGGYYDDWSVMKFSPEGAVLWEVRYDYDQGFHDELANGMFDAAGNVVVAGTVGTDFGSRSGDVAVAKYSPEGAVLWQRVYGQADRHEFVGDFGIDQAGTIYLIGGRAASASIYESAVELWLKYSPEGALVGETLGGPTGNGDFGTAVVDRDGNLYAATFSRLTRYSPAGALLWRTEFTSPVFGATIPIVQHSPTGEIVLGATSFDGSYLGDYLIYAFDAAGTLRWRYRFNGSANGDDTLEGLAVDSVGNVIATGTSWNNYASIGGSADDIVTLKFGGGQSAGSTAATSPTSPNPGRRGRSGARR